MTKIFITIPWFVPAFRAGGPVQSVANMVKEFKEDVEYFIVCQDVDLNGAVLENIETDKWIQYNDHTQVWYASPEKISDNIVKEIENKNPDILFIIGIFSWHFNLVPLLFCKKPKKILSVRGMLNQGALSQKKWKKRIYLQAFKMMKLHHKISFHASGEEEKKYIQNTFGNECKIFMAGNFPNKISPLPVAEKEPGKLKLASIALISPMKNILLVLQALEKIEASIQYDIYGPVKDEDYWERCLLQIKKLPANISVVVHKEIEPLRVKEALLDAHVFILPSKSENFGHAIYEALSAGRPVVTSNNTPWNNLRESSAGINIAVENNNEIEEAISFFAMMDEETLFQWHRGAIDYAEKAVDVELIKNEYEKMFGEGSSKT